MKRIIVSAVAALAVLLPPAAAQANSPAQHFEFDVTGEVLATCPSGTYTFTAGSIAIVLHEGVAANGNTNFTVTERPRGVVLVNELGEVFTLRGANWFGGTSNANTGDEVLTATHKMSIIQAGGGVVETFNMVERFRDGELITATSAAACGPSLRARHVRGYQRRRGDCAGACNPATFAGLAGRSGR